jgi:hypothetical protein
MVHLIGQQTIPSKHIKSLALSPTWFLCSTVFQYFNLVSEYHVDKPANNGVTKQYILRTSLIHRIGP